MTWQAKEYLLSLVFSFQSTHRIGNPIQRNAGEHPPNRSIPNPPETHRSHAPLLPSHRPKKSASAHRLTGYCFRTFGCASALSHQAEQPTRARARQSLKRNSKAPAPKPLDSSLINLRHRSIGRAPLPSLNLSVLGSRFKSNDPEVETRPPNLDTHFPRTKERRTGVWGFWSKSLRFACRALLPPAGDLFLFFFVPCFTCCLRAHMPFLFQALGGGWRRAGI